MQQQATLLIDDIPGTAKKDSSNNIPVSPKKAMGSAENPVDLLSSPESVVPRKSALNIYSLSRVTAAEPQAPIDEPNATSLQNPDGDASEAVTQSTNHRSNIQASFNSPNPFNINASSTTPAQPQNARGNLPAQISSRNSSLPPSGYFSAVNPARRGRPFQARLLAARARAQAQASRRLRPQSVAPEGIHTAQANRPVFSQSGTTQNFSNNSQRLPQYLARHTNQVAATAAAPPHPTTTANLPIHPTPPIAPPANPNQPAFQSQLHFAYTSGLRAEFDRGLVEGHNRAMMRVPSSDPLSFNAASTSAFSYSAARAATADDVARIRRDAPAFLPEFRVERGGVVRRVPAAEMSAAEWVVGGEEEEEEERETWAGVEGVVVGADGDVMVLEEDEKGGKEEERNGDDGAREGEGGEDDDGKDMEMVQ